MRASSKQDCGRLFVICCLLLCCLDARAQHQAQDQRLGQAPPKETPQTQQPASQEPQAPQPQAPQAPEPSQLQAPESPEAPQPQTPTQEEPNPHNLVTGIPVEAKKFGQTTLNKMVDWESGWLTGPYVAKDRPLVPVTAEQRWRIYLQQTLTTPSAYFKRMFVAGVDQLRENPVEWGDGWGAYGQRFASREGQFISANSLAALGNAALRYEPRYDQCKCSGKKRRAWHAIMRNFLTYNESEQELRPQWALYGGAFAGGVISATWKPQPRNVWRDGGIGVMGQAGYGALLNFFTEFAGDINKKIRAKIGGRKAGSSPALPGSE